MVIGDGLYIKHQILELLQKILIILEQNYIKKMNGFPEKGGRLTGTCKVMQVSVSGDARVAASYSVVVGQIHSGEGHENEPLKIFYKNFRVTKKDLYFGIMKSTHLVRIIQVDGIFHLQFGVMTFQLLGKVRTTIRVSLRMEYKIGEEFSYEINVYKGIMYLTFKSDNHETKTFTKNLILSGYTNKKDLPEQVKKLIYSARTRWYRKS